MDDSAAELRQELEKVRAEVGKRREIVRQLSAAVAELSEEHVAAQREVHLRQGDSRSVVLGEAYRRRMTEKRQRLEGELAAAQAALSRAEERFLMIEKEMGA